MSKLIMKLVLILSTLIMFSCSDKDPGISSQRDAKTVSEPKIQSSSDLETANTDRLVTYTENREACADYQPERKPLFGELHVHTAYSFDAAAVRTNTSPEDAYRFAQGKPISFFPLDENGKPAGEITIDRPLDFVAVTDHAEMLGENALCKEPDSPAYNGAFCIKNRESEFLGAAMLATSFSTDPPERIKLLCGENGELCRNYAAGPWQRIIDAAEQAYDRSSECSFTSFIGYEYTGSPNNSNYHRNVIFRNDNVPALPVSYIEAPFDYQLWEQMAKVCNDENSCDYLTIPHNSNLSNGRLLTPYANLEQTMENRLAYARSRLENEPLMEVFQHKGSSECVNGMKAIIGAPDELCDVEQLRNPGSIGKRINIKLEGLDFTLETEDPAAETVECEDKGRHGLMGGGCVAANDFLRTALLTGLVEEQEIGLNPVKLGVIAASDGHTGTPGSVVESDWKGYVTGEMTLEKRLKPGTLPSGFLGNPGGLAGVWAMENSRDAIFEAMQRREVFGTSGPRIIPRFFAGWGFAENSCESADMVTLGYAEGVPMGADLPSLPDANAMPSFIASALRDPSETAAPLKKLQIVKGWVNAEGKQHYKVYDVAGDQTNNAGVDTSTGKRFGEGHNSLCAVFTDTEFDPKVPAYYYLRVVENPSPRWSLLDCLKLDAVDRPQVCEDSSKHVIHEMAWSSPVWYSP
jgi:Protein of unknown function (DUF3604)